MGNVEEEENATAEQSKSSNITLPVMPSMIFPIEIEPFASAQAYVVQSSNKETYYLVFADRACSCPDFVSRAQLKRGKKECRHIRAIKWFTSFEEQNDFGRPIKSIEELRSYLEWL